MSGERRGRLVKLGSAAAFLALAVVASLIVVSQSQTSGGDTKLESTAQVEDLLRGITQSGTALGDTGAKVALFEFGDLQCPVCKGYAEEILPQVIEGPVRRGEAKIDFQNFTIIGPQSKPAGAAELAASEQGRGWSFIELFYRNQGAENSGYVTDAFLTAIAKSAGVPDIAAWNASRKSKRTLATVARTTRQAQGLGFTGTPSFAIGGPNTGGLKPLGTVGSAEELEAAIAAAG